MDIAPAGKLSSRRETLLPIHLHIRKKAVTLIRVDCVGKSFPRPIKARTIVTF